MTAEKRKRRCAERKAEKEALKRRLPYGRLESIKDSYGVVLELEEGETATLAVLARGEWPEDDRFPKLWKRTYIWLELESLGEFIAALTARYNEFVRRANRIATQAMEPLKEVEQQALSPELSINVHTEENDDRN